MPLLEFHHIRIPPLRLRNQKPSTSRSKDIANKENPKHVCEHNSVRVGELKEESG
jgi:hypothetical protein